MNSSGTQSTRRDRKAFREDLIKHISRIPELDFDIDNLVKGDKSRFFSITASYPKRFGDHASIRPELKLEGTFVDDALPGLEEKEIKAIIGEHIETDNNSAIRCLSLLETTADKSSALVWRVLSRDRAEEGDDPSIIRHLYDLHELFGQFEDLHKIAHEANTRYERDRSRGREDIPETFDIALTTVLAILKNDPLYNQEYNQYALNMCFGRVAPPDFDVALKSFSSLSDHLL